MTISIVKSDCLEFLRTLPENSVDLVFGSPPYEKARLYLENGENLNIARNTDQWVAWMTEVFKESLRVSKGLVAFVVDGQTKNYRYSGGPILLWADLIRAGITTRKAPIYHRISVPGSGRPDWFRNDYEFVICATKGGRLPWSNNTACGHPPKYGPGGVLSHRTVNGARVKTGRAIGGKLNKKAAVEDMKRGAHGGRSGEIQEDGSILRANGTTYTNVKIANPGNVIEETYTSTEVEDLLAEFESGDWVHCTVGGGKIGSHLAHKNEAPFPEKLVERFVLSFCPLGGTVLDCFAGSGTTAAVAVRHGRSFVGCDLRQSQVDLSLRRVDQEQPLLQFEEATCQSDAKT